MIDIFKALEERILILDGALGTMIQALNLNENDYRGRVFLSHPRPLKGFNDILNITKPSYIQDIHLQYIEAGANIITTNTFNSNKISMSDYGLEEIEGISKKLNKEGALLARRAIDEYKKKNENIICFVGGSIGPTNRSASLSPDISDPILRNISYDKLYNAYKEQAEGLIEGGIDIFICETFFDTLNLKAALDAINYVLLSRGITKPIMVSATVSDKAGRILSGQTLEAFITSISDYKNVKVIGLNCGFGPEQMKDYLISIDKINPHYTSCHPNAGFPDQSGCYNLTKEDFIKSILDILNNTRINIIGGCCGTTPDFIKLLSDTVTNIHPKIPNKSSKCLCLSGLERLEIDKTFVVIGERCNVAGSKKFLNLIKERKFEEAAEIAKLQIERGAEILDINMDDPLIDSKKDMIDFLRYILADPEIAKVPFMIDSSNWDVIENALKNIQGKGIVNSLSLKEGEKKFIYRAKRVKELGFALVVMAFDEKGQAETYNRKVEIVKRSYKILTEKCGFSPEDIIFDVNIMTIGTGMKEHAKYAIDFIETVAWIKNNLHGTRTSGGVSNISFAFRGKNKIREWMHVVFLYHAKKAGLDMAIINPSQNYSYEEIPIEVRKIIEDLIFNKREDAVEKVIELANISIKPLDTKETVIKEYQDLTIEEILKEDMVKGEIIQLEKHLVEAIEKLGDPIKIIEGPLLEGMEKVGTLFGEGKMFLPQVVKTARSMKKAVEILTPYIENIKIKNPNKKKGKILIATVKGDVHDIGKNIVSTVLACNNFEIIDLGIMVSSEKIVEVALNENPDIICLSGLITPSLVEMTTTVSELKRAGINVPVMVGGAATSLLHTALKINPEYDGIVLHMSDASQNPIAAGKLLNKTEKVTYLREVEKIYAELIKKNKEKIALTPYDEVLQKVKELKRNSFTTRKPKIELHNPIKIMIPIDEIIPLINWKMFFLAWNLKGFSVEELFQAIKNDSPQIWIENLDDSVKDQVQEVIKVYKTAEAFLNQLKTSGLYDGCALIRFEKAKGDIKNIYIGNKVFPMIRQQRHDSDFLSCSDFVGDYEENYIGMFVVTVGKYLMSLIKNSENSGDSYSNLILQTLADRLVEASSEWLQEYVSTNYWEVGIRPAWGYPMLPDQTLILKTTDFLPYNEIGVSLTENGAMYPPSTISGLYFSPYKTKYFITGQIGEDQIQDYAERRKMKIDKVKAILRFI